MSSVSREASPKPNTPSASPPNASSASPAPAHTSGSSSGATVAAAGSPQLQLQQLNVPVNALITDMLRSHKHRVAQLKDQAEHNHKAATQSAVNACQALVDVSNAEVIDVFNAESKIEQHLKDVCAQTEQLHRRMQQWAQLFVKFNRALKEIGDVAHWSHMVEVDMKETVQILEAISAKKREQTGAAA